jgi:hypothetical protein
VTGPRLLALTQGKYALLDPADADRAEAFRWHAVRAGVKWYAARAVPGSPKGSRRKERLHHFVLGLPSGSEIDHENGDGLDCRRENLRPATRRQNMQNPRQADGPLLTLQGRDVGGA